MILASNLDQSLIIRRRIDYELGHLTTVSFTGLNFFNFLTDIFKMHHPTTFKWIDFCQRKHKCHVHLLAGLGKAWESPKIVFLRRF